MCNNNCFGGNNCLWIIILLILFCGCGNMGGMTANNGCGNNCGCGGHDCCCYALNYPGLPCGRPFSIGRPRGRRMLSLCIVISEGTPLPGCPVRRGDRRTPRERCPYIGL